MNHDYAHCLDFGKDCPKKCFRAQLTNDLKRRPDLLENDITWASFLGSDQCSKQKEHPRKV